MVAYFIWFYLFFDYVGMCVVAKGPDVGVFMLSFGRIAPRMVRAAY